MTEREDPITGPPDRPGDHDPVDEDENGGASARHRDEERRSAALREEVVAALGGEFDVVRSLGRGRMAEVFLAREVELRRLVAVKVLRPELARKEAPRKRFLREARSAARISHPHVVQIHRVGSLADETPFLTMEFIDGRTMDDVLAAEGPRPEEEVRELLLQMAGALQAAHDQGIVHRDVRPNNIMRRREGNRFILMDFGVAGILETGGESVTRLTGAGEILGYVRYTAPEQLEGRAAQPESDIYSLAITAYELLTGRGPWDDEGVADVIHAHLHRPPLPLSRFRPGTGRDLQELLMRSLAKRPEHRPTARTLADRLARPRDTERIGVVREESALGEFLRELRRRKVYQVGVAYAAFAFVVLQAGEVILPPLGADMFYKGFVVLILAGFPVTLVLSWIFDLTSRGIERTAGQEETTLKTRLLQGGGILLSLAIVAALAWWIL